MNPAQLVQHDHTPTSASRMRTPRPERRAISVDIARESTRDANPGDVHVLGLSNNGQAHVLQRPVQMQSFYGHIPVQSPQPSQGIRTHTLLSCSVPAHTLDTAMPNVPHFTQTQLTLRSGRHAPHVHAMLCPLRP
eukprot:1898456-Amphidinium_carterae.3